MTAEIGHFSLILALLVSLGQAAVPLIGLGRRDPALAIFADQAAFGAFVFIVIAFACLTYAFVNSDFSIQIVAANSHTAKPLLYTIAGVWGNHEGSLLLWVLILTLFGAAVAMFGGNLPDTLRSNVLGVHGMLGLGFLAFILFTSNPFGRQYPASVDGNGLSPRRLMSMLIDKPMPAFALASLSDDGQGFSNADLTGKVALLNVFASWCPACRIEHPTLMAVARNGTVPIYGVNWKDRADNGARWLKANKSPYVRIGDDPGGRLGIDLGVTGVPETFVVDRTGRIRYRHAGPITNDVWRETFEPLLAALGAER